MDPSLLFLPPDQKHNCRFYPEPIQFSFLHLYISTFVHFYICTFVHFCISERGTYLKSNVGIRSLKATSCCFSHFLFIYINMRTYQSLYDTQSLCDIHNRHRLNEKCRARGDDFARESELYGIHRDIYIFAYHECQKAAPPVEGLNSERNRVS